MRTSAILLALCLAACAGNNPPPLDPWRANASLPAVDFGALKSWQALRDGSVLLEGAGGKYQRATFTAPCPALANAPALSLKISKFGAEDRVQGVTPASQPGPPGAAPPAVVEPCYFNTLEPIDDPKSLAIAAPSAPVEGRALPAPGR